MKNLFFILLFFVSCINFAQNYHILKTNDGRRVLLKEDYSWEYIDREKILVDSTKIDLATFKEKDKCTMDKDFVEPALNNKIQSQLKKGRATINDIKRKVAKDYNCAEEEVVLLSFSEKKASGIYHFCANGNKVSYKRNGFTIIKSGKFF